MTFEGRSEPCPEFRRLDKVSGFPLLKALQKLIEAIMVLGQEFVETGNGHGGFSFVLLPRKVSGTKVDMAGGVAATSPIGILRQLVHLPKGVCFFLGACQLIDRWVQDVLFLLVVRCQRLKKLLFLA